MTRLPPPEQWVLSKMSEMEVAEMIEEHIDYYTVDEDGTRRSVHLPTPFVRHFMKRSDRVLPTVVAIATSPIVLADGELLAPDGLDRLRGQLAECFKEGSIRAAPRIEPEFGSSGRSVRCICQDVI